MATTQKGTYYPDDYSKIADVPADMKKMAESIDKQTDNLVQKEEGKGLSSNDFTNEFKQKLEGLENYDDTEVKQDILNLDTNKASKAELQEATIALQAELKATRKDLQAGTLEGQDTGESLYLQDSSDARFRSFGIGGNSKQETRDGYNYINTSKLVTTENSGITATYLANGKIRLNGTSTAMANLYIRNLNKQLKAGTYTAKTNLTSTELNGVIFRDSDNASIISGVTNKKTATIEQDTVLDYILIQIRSGVTLNNFDFEIMLYEGTADKEWEQYGAMPSLEFSSPIQAVGQDVNIFDSSIFEDIEQNGVKIKRNSDGTLTLNGTYTGTSSWNYRFNLPNPIITNTKEQLYLSMQKIKGNCTGQIRFTVWEANSDNRWLSFETNQYADLLKEKTYSRASIIIYAGAIFNNLTMGLKISNKKEAMYSPYNHGSVKVTVCNKNILPTQLEKTQTVNGITVTNNKGRLTINGTSTAGFQFDIAKNFYLPKNNSVFNPNEISGTVANTEEGVFPTYSMRNADNVQLITGMANRVGKNIEKTISASLLGNIIKFCTLWIPKNTVFNNFVIEPQIEAGNTATDYVAHEEQTLTMPVQQEMLEEDFLDLDNEEEVHTWGKYVFTGEESISKSGITNNNSFWMNSNFLPNLLNAEILNYTATDSITPNVLCTHLKTLKPVLIVSYDNEGITICANDNNLTDITIRLGFGKSSEINTTDKCKAWLKQQYEAGTPVTVYYKLKTPTKLPFTEAQKAVAKQIRETLHSYKGGTHVYSVDEVSPTFNVKYTRDQEAYIKNQLKPIIQELTGGN